MRIPKTLVQFENHRALFVVTGAIEAEFYVAYQGEMSLVKSFTIPKPVYSDREDRSRGNGRSYENGGKFEIIKNSMATDFAKELKKTFKELTQEKFDLLYVFCPAKVHNVVETALPAPLKKKLVRVWKGNYQHEKPSGLLEKIKKIQ